MMLLAGACMVPGAGGAELNFARLLHADATDECNNGERDAGPVAVDAAGDAAHTTGNSSDDRNATSIGGTLQQSSHRAHSPFHRKGAAWEVRHSDTMR